VAQAFISLSLDLTNNAQAKPRAPQRGMAATNRNSPVGKGGTGVLACPFSVKCKGRLISANWDVLRMPPY